MYFVLTIFISSDTASFPSLNIILIKMSIYLANETSFGSSVKLKEI